MAIECAVIAAMFAVMSIVFFRKKRSFWGWATLPLILVPLTEFVFDMLLVSAIQLSIGPYGRIIAILVAVAVSCAWIGFVSGGMKNKKRRITYIGIANVFNVLLAAILIYNILMIEI
ncbi:MAG: hypothetical protein J6A16_01695 [Oscillospiraceae bacterium]|nr:hypothetical protein [Oscillospiraceae bacterium]